MAELADALDSGSSGSDPVQVQVLLSAPNQKNPNLFLVGNGFGFFLHDYTIESVLIGFKESYQNTLFLFHYFCYSAEYIK